MPDAGMACVSKLVVKVPPFPIAAVLDEMLMVTVIVSPGCG